jgi:hypothetical protein
MNAEACALFLTPAKPSGSIRGNNAHQGYARRKAGTLKLVGYFFVAGA